MKKSYLFLIIFIILTCCKSYEPFENKKEKKLALKYIQSNFDFTKPELKKLKSNDSILFGVSKSLKKHVNNEKIKRRVDSFLLGSYNVKQLWTILYVEREFPNRNFEINKSKTLKSFEFKDVDELRSFFKRDGFDSVVKNNMKIKTKTIKDSTNKKKQ